MIRTASRSLLQHAARQPRLIARQSTSSSLLPEFFNQLAHPEGGEPTSLPIPSTPPENDAPPTAGPNSFPKDEKAFSPIKGEASKYNYLASDKRQRLRLYFQSTRNNTIATLTTGEGNPIFWTSGGNCGFKKSNRNSYEAGYQCAVKMFKKIEERAEELGGLMEWELIMKEYGQGRKALTSALLAVEGEKVRGMLKQISDRTAIKVGGTRSKKARRL
ncbi:translational machinery component [Punctularia strigosozonata HHB-11173 SS5]|uniref:translational machinery component n=1 Tax=Punctularia strigosozonata (strain HHB-11173) TaxID=741275 RepID=UPI000441760C|nr:translational machinery component [Punctularia strigosozonata HHB-11173 SS5]EIN10297.1 translational machinery component [Punctularia strigosozonata HHB-11173 SS5]